MVEPNCATRRTGRDVEGGVLIEDEGFARRVAGQWRSLVKAALVRKHRG
jgi:hypothetical protein